MEVSVLNAEANNTGNKAQELCEKLYLAAKRSKTRRFHALYDKVFRMDFLEEAWKQVKSNKGSAGVDNETINDILEKGEDIVLTKIQEVLKAKKKYRPRKVKRVYIPKPDGSNRPLGIPTVRDRIIQTSAKMTMEPIFEADFLDCNYGFRPNRSAHDALEEIRATMNRGYRIVLDADIKGFFDNINHGKLLDFVCNRINDRKFLKLIRKWLECGVMESGVAYETSTGTPQGGVISPLLANIYLHEFDKYWIHESGIDSKLIRYADDFVILFKTEEDAKYGLNLVKSKLKELDLELNEEKTRIVDTNKGNDGFDFLGFHHRRVMSNKYRKYYTQKWPSKKSMKSIRDKIRGAIGSRSILNKSIEDVVEELNPILKGWMNYFRFGNSWKCFTQIDSFVHERMALWWRKKHQKSGRGWKSDFTWAKYKRTGIQILTGNITYWSTYRKHRKEGHRKAVWGRTTCTV